MKIMVSGPAVALDSRTAEEIRDTHTLKSLDGLRYQDDLCELPRQRNPERHQHRRRGHRHCVR